MTADLDSPVFLLGMPRSGTTWLSQIFESSRDFVVRLSPPYSYAFRGRLTEASGRDEWRQVLQGTIASSDAFLTQNWRRDTGELTDFDKDAANVARLAVKDTRFHRLYRAGMSVLPRAKSIYIIRHPAAALWSWRNCKEFPAEADFAIEWRRALQETGWAGRLLGLRRLAGTCSRLSLCCEGGSSTLSDRAL